MVKLLRRGRQGVLPGFSDGRLEAEEAEQRGGGSLGVERLEVVREVKRAGFGGERRKRAQDRFRRELRRSRTDEDVVRAVHFQQDAGIAFGGGAHIQAVRTQNGGDEDAELGGLVDEEDARAASLRNGGACGALQEGADGFVFGGVTAQNAGELGELEQGDEERGWRGEANVAATLAETGGRIRTSRPRPIESSRVSSATERTKRWNSCEAKSRAISSSVDSGPRTMRPAH